MNIPSQIKIGGLNYSVEFVKNLIRDRSASGQSCGNEQSITIDSSSSKQLQETTLVHEIIEQINFVYNTELEHHQICLLEAGLYAVMKDNPKVFENVAEPQQGCMCKDSSLQVTM